LPANLLPPIRRQTNSSRANSSRANSSPNKFVVVQFVAGQVQPRPVTFFTIP
jgi:hypothetical protein